MTAEQVVTSGLGAESPGTPGTVVTPSGGPPARTVRRAKVAVTRVDPWSVMKISFSLFVALGIVILVAVALLWWVLDSSGVFDQVSQSVLKITGTTDTSGNPTTGSFQLQNYIGIGRVMGVTTILVVINTILLTALATLGAFLFNLSAGLVGGIDITLTETD